MKNESYKNLLEAIKDRNNLILDLGDNIILHMRWNPVENIYEDEMGKTSMKLIQEIINGMVRIENKLVTIREDK